MTPPTPAVHPDETPYDPPSVMTGITVGRVPNVERTPRRTIRVPDDLWHTAKLAAAREGRTVTEVVNDALRDYIGQSGDEPSGE